MANEPRKGCLDSLIIIEEHIKTAHHIVHFNLAESHDYVQFFFLIFIFLFGSTSALNEVPAQARMRFPFYSFLTQLKTNSQGFY